VCKNKLFETLGKNIENFKLLLINQENFESDYFIKKEEMFETFENFQNNDIRKYLDIIPIVNDFKFFKNITKNQNNNFIENEDNCDDSDDEKTEENQNIIKYVENRKLPKMKLTMWNDPIEYINTLYLLLRADYISPFIDGIKKLIDQENLNKKKLKFQDLPIYYDIYFQFLSPKKNCSLKFKILGRKNLRLSSKNLIYNSLLLLYEQKNNIQQDFFKESDFLNIITTNKPIIVTIADRTYINDNIIDIEFYREKDLINFDFDKVFFAIESSCYFGRFE
jgi:hypothetical protein